jgi:hypothetical protein
MPALLGALATPMFFKDKTAIKAASVPSLIAMAISLAIGFAAFAQLTSLAMPIFMAIAVGWRYILYKSDLKKTENT